MIIQKRIEEISGNWKMHLWFLALLQIFKVLVLRIFKTIYVLPYFLREKVLRKKYSFLSWFYCIWPKEHSPIFSSLVQSLEHSTLVNCIFVFSGWVNFETYPKWLNVQYFFIHSYYLHPHKYIPPLLSQLQLFWLLRQQVALKSSLLIEEIRIGICEDFFWCHHYLVHPSIPSAHYLSTYL